MQWNDLSALLENYLQQEPPIADFTNALPSISSTAELRIYREMDFFGTRGENTTLSTTIGTNTYDLSTLTGQQVGGFAVAYQNPVQVERVAASVSSNWVPFNPVSLDFLRYVWPNPVTTGIPGAAGIGAYFAMTDHKTLILAPTPVAIYNLRITGRWRPAPLSPTVSANYLGDVYPDLLLAAAMVEGLTWMRDIGGAAAQDPGAVDTWQKLYETRKANAIREEARKAGYGRRTFGRVAKAGATPV